jgi:hypothetical protein
LCISKRILDSKVLTRIVQTNQSDVTTNVSFTFTDGFNGDTITRSFSVAGNGNNFFEASISPGSTDIITFGSFTVAANTGDHGVTYFEQVRLDVGLFLSPRRGQCRS